MPHIIVKLYPGRSEEKKQNLSDEIVKKVALITECKDAVISVAIEEIEPDDWAQQVYQPDILDGKGKLYKKPGYNPFESKSDEIEQQTGLMEHVRAACLVAHKEDTTGDFNPMSWLDLELEDHPDSFDSFFDIPWENLSEPQRAERAMAIRMVL